MARKTDSAGVPWQGRAFEHNAFSSDDGSIPIQLASALADFAAGQNSQVDVVNAIRSARLLIPLIAVLGESEKNERGMTVDKSQELSIVTVAGPDGRTVLPVFASVTAMSAWNSNARPVPADGVRVALAAAAEGTEIVVLDPTSPTEFVIRRPTLWAMARDQEWMPSWLDPEVARALERGAGAVGIRIESIGAGDPFARLAGPELVVHIVPPDFASKAERDTALGRLDLEWRSDPVVAERVDSIGIRLAPKAS